MEFATLREKIAHQKLLRQEQYKLFQTAAFAATKAAHEAAEAHVPEPMYVSGYSEPVRGGVCGFAWLEAAGNRRLGKWLKTNVGFRKDYGGGLMCGCPLPTQSLSTKEAWVRAYVDTFNQHLEEAGLPDRIRWQSRID
jgi:hypothetical protein